ncbi:hypothetical protein D3C78_1683210 [compost metagenome]
MGVGWVFFQRFSTGREQRIEQLQVDQHFEGIGGVSREEQLERFLEQARGRDFAQHRCQLADRLHGVLFDTEVQLGGKTYGTQHPHRVFLVTLGRITD